MNSKTLLLYRIAAVAATGGLLFGFDTGIINVAMPFLRKQWVIDSNTEAWIVSMVLIGGMAGSLLSGRLADGLGRKRINLLAALIFVVGSILTAITPSPASVMFAVEFPPKP